MNSVATTTLVVAGFLVLIGLVQPAAERLRLPYAVVLAVVGVAVGALASFLLYTPMIDVFNDVVRPIVELPFNASIFLVVFLPILLFHAALMIDAREVAEDAAPILILAIVAVFAAAAAIGFSLHWAAGVPLIVALLLGSIVATTDPAAVVAILHEVGAPPRLTRLLEGESLLNDAAAIVLFTVLVEMLSGGAEPDAVAGIEHFLVAFLGGIVLGAVGGRVYGAIVPYLGGSRMAEVTLAVALPYVVYLVGDLLDVSGVVAVASAGLVAGSVARVRMTPENWRYLEQLWEQLGFWGSSLIFITASALVPRLLTGMHPQDAWLLVIAIGAALVSRAAVLFGLFPLLSALRLSQKVSAAYNLAITWGGLRGAVTLALALSVTENAAIRDQGMKDLVAVLATGFVLFTLLFNGLTLRPVIHLLRLDRLSPLDQALRDKVLALSFSDVRDAIRDTAKEYAITPSAASAAAARYSHALAEETAHSEPGSAISERDRMTIALVATTNQEHRIVLDHHSQHTVSGTAIERLRRNTKHLLDAAKTEGEEGYNRAAVELLKFPRGFRFANFLHRSLHIDGPLQRQISIRFETLLVRRLVLGELARFTGSRLRRLLGGDVCEKLGKIIEARSAATTRALDALRLQYPDHAEALERRFLEQSGLRLLLARYDNLYAEGLIGRELFDDLEREHGVGRLAAEQPPLDLGLRTEELIGNIAMFAKLGPDEVKALARHFRPRLLVPDEAIIRKGERGTEMFMISSGAVEVVLPGDRVRLGSGEFFGEMAILRSRRRQADVIALGYCRVLVLSAAEFRRFLREFPAAKAEIDRVAAARDRENAARASG